MNQESSVLSSLTIAVGYAWRFTNPEGLERVALRHNEYFSRCI